MLRTLTATAIAAVMATAAFAEPAKYELDPSHSQIVFGWTHQGYSTTWAVFSGFDGTIMFDQDNPANSSVTVTIPATSIWSGWDKRDQHITSGDFLGAGEDDMITFTSTGIEVTGDSTAMITGTLTYKDMSTEVTLDTVMNKAGQNQRSGKPYLGFDATTSFNRSELGAGAFAPVVGDELKVMLSIEAEGA